MSAPRRACTRSRVRISSSDANNARPNSPRAHTPCIILPARFHATRPTSPSRFSILDSHPCRIAKLQKYLYLIALPTLVRSASLSISLDLPRSPSFSLLLAYYVLFALCPLPTFSLPSFPPLGPPMLARVLSMRRVCGAAYLHAPDLRRPMTHRVIEANPVLPFSVLYRRRFLPTRNRLVGRLRSPRSSLSRGQEIHLLGRTIEERTFQSGQDCQEIADYVRLTGGDGYAVRLLTSKARASAWRRGAKTVGRGARRPRGLRCLAPVALRSFDSRPFWTRGSRRQF